MTLQELEHWAQVVQDQEDEARAVHKGPRWICIDVEHPGVPPEALRELKRADLPALRAQAQRDQAQAEERARRAQRTEEFLAEKAQLSPEEREQERVASVAKRKARREQDRLNAQALSLKAQDMARLGATPRKIRRKP